MDRETGFTPVRGSSTPWIGRRIPQGWAAGAGPHSCSAWSSCGAGSAGRMNPFLRDEPPMLGTVNSPTADSAPDERPPGSTGATARVADRRPATANDLYGQSFNRDPTQAVASAPAPTNRSPPRPACAQTAAAAENGVRTTAHDTTADPGTRRVILKPPVSLQPATDTTAPRPGGAIRGIARNPSPRPPPHPPKPRNRTRRRPKRSSPAPPRLDGLHSYQVAMNRQERVGDSLQAPEDVLLSIRRNPRAVRLSGNEGPHQGREVLFSEKETNGMLLVNMADSKIPVPRFSLPPDSPLALHNSRHPITEAGFDTIVGNLQKTIDENKAGDRSHGRIAYAGLEQPAELDHPCHKIVRVTGQRRDVAGLPGSRVQAARAWSRPMPPTATCSNATFSAGQT